MGRRRLSLLPLACLFLLSLAGCGCSEDSEEIVLPAGEGDSATAGDQPPPEVPGDDPSSEVRDLTAVPEPEGASESISGGSVSGAEAADPPAAPLPEAIEATPPPDTTPPLVSSTHPVDHEEAASRRWPIVATFSEEIDCSTVTPSTFKMTLGGDDIRGTPSCSGIMVRFDPADPLQFDTTYTARLTTGIRDLAGNRLPMDYSWSFTMAEGGWRGADSIDDDGAGWSPAVAAAGENFAAAWHHTTPSGTRVAWSKSTGAGVWDDLRVIGFGGGWGEGWGAASTPDISLSRAGLAYLTWTELHEGRQIVRGFVPTLRGPTFLSYQLTGNAFCPQVAAAPDGDAIVVWRQVSGVLKPLYARRFDMARQLWTDPVLLVTRVAGIDYNPSCPQVAVDGGGNTFVVSETLGTNGSAGPVFSHRFDAALSRWEGRRVIAESYEKGPQLAVSANGDAFVAWRTMNPAWPNHWEIWVKRFTGTGWELGRTRVKDTYLSGAASTSGAKVTPRLAVDPYGNALLVGRERVPSGRYNIYAIRFSRETEEWGEDERISSEEGENDKYLTTALDPYGNAFVVWVRTEEGRQRLYARRSLPSGIWAPRAALDELLDGNAGNPQLAVNSRGEGSVVWTQTEEPGNPKVMGNFFGELRRPWAVMQPDRARVFLVDPSD